LINYDASHSEIIEILNDTRRNDLDMKTEGGSYPFSRCGLDKFVYIINFGADYYKIGITHSPSQRLRNFQSSNPFVSGTDSVIALFVYRDWEKRRKDASDRGLVRSSLFSKSKTLKRFRRANGDLCVRPYALLHQLEKAIHLWCIERDFAFDEVRKGNQITTEIFKLNPEELGELFKAITSWGFATIPRDSLHNWIVPEDRERNQAMTYTMLERKIS
jgi:hypothetical protein